MLWFSRHFFFVCFVWCSRDSFGADDLFGLPEVYTASEESGAEDSDEDIITDYLSPLDDNGNVDAAGAAGSASTGAATVAGSAGAMDDPSSTHSKDACGRSTEVDSVTSAASAAAAGADGGVIPTISVTQHSPAASKAFYILGKSIHLVPILIVVSRSLWRTLLQHSSRLFCDSFAILGLCDSLGVTQANMASQF